MTTSLIFVPRARRPGGALAAIMALLFAVVTGLAVASPAAMAAPGDSTGPGGFAIPGVTSWYGQYHLASGAIVYCADLNSEGPRSASGWASSLATSFQKQTGWSRSSIAGRAAVNGPMMTGTELARVSWVLNTYGSRSDPGTAAAVEHFIRVNTVGDQAQADREATRWAGAIALDPAVQTAYGTIVADADSWAGPYRIAVEWQTPPTTSNSGSGRFQVLNGKGVALPGIPVTVSYSGGSFTAVDAVTGPGGIGTFKVPAGSAGTEARVNVTASLANPYPMVYTSLNWASDPARDGLVQRMLGASGSTIVDGHATATVTVVTPTVTTRTSSAIVAAGAPLSDVITVSGGRPNAAFSGTSSLYGPLAEAPVASAAAPAGTPKVGTATYAGTYDATGRATVTTTALVVPSPGFYVWQETLSATPGVHPEVTGPYGAPTETSLVLARPRATTRTSSVLVKAGDQLRDTVEIVDGAPNMPFRGTATLYGPVAVEPTPSDSVPTGVPVVGTATFSGTYDAAGKATVQTTPLVVASEGYYTWQETLAATPTSAGFTGRYGEASETSLVHSPAITTQASTQTAVTGSTISDAVTVRGIRTSVGGAALTTTVSGTLYGPVSPLVDSRGARTCEGLDWAHAPVATRITPFVVTKDGTTTGVGSYVVAGEGCYTYAEMLTWSLAGGGSGQVEHLAGHPTQTVLVSAPEPAPVLTIDSGVPRMVGNSLIEVSAIGLLLIVGVGLASRGVADVRRTR